MIFVNALLLLLCLKIKRRRFAIPFFVSILALATMLMLMRQTNDLDPQVKLGAGLHEFPEVPFAVASGFGDTLDGIYVPSKANPNVYVAADAYPDPSQDNKLFRRTLWRDPNPTIGAKGFSETGCPDKKTCPDNGRCA